MVNELSLRAMLGISADVPMTPDAMARSLRVCFFPGGTMTPALEAFTTRLKTVMMACGVQVIPYEDAIAAGKKGKIQEGVVIIAPGELHTGNLPVDHVSNLRTTTVVGIIDGPFLAEKNASEQEKLNAIVRHLGWSIMQVAIFVESDAWTICTMNGAIIPCPRLETFREDVIGTLIPKLAAPVVPPHASDFEFEDGALDLRSPAYEPYVNDFVKGAPLWADTGLMLFHTSLDSLSFRSTYYRRIAAAYLDRRSGMSYGFLARQIAAVPGEVLELSHAPQSAAWKKQGYVWHQGRLHVRMELQGQEVAVEVPSVQVLSTRSGCDKAHIDGHRDLMLLELSGGKITIKTPQGGEGIDYRPSYDTQTILAHALGNALILSLETYLGRQGAFSLSLASSGMALAHWHGTLETSLLPREYSVFGDENPPVSCSTRQAALFALNGKLQAFTAKIERGHTYAGDVHIEPHHGINVSWPSLEGLARHLLGMNGALHGEPAVDIHHSRG